MENYKKEYEEKLELARNRYYDLSITGEEKKFLEKLFPVLKESRDERIRLSIIKLVKQHSVNHERCQMEKWLEEQKKIDILDEEERKFVEDVDSYRKDMNEAYQRGFNEGVRITLEKQKSEGDEPKFKAGDWVVYDNNIVCHIDRIYQEKKMYTITDTNNMVSSYSIKSFDIISHLWTIQDAMPGDVLTTDAVYFIFKSNDDLHCNMYCHYSVTSDKVDISDTAIVASTYVHPATKEQRDTLIKAIADDGYIFDFEKKELKKIEQKNAWSEEDEKMHAAIIYTLAGFMGNEDKIDWLHSFKERYTWKPSKEQMENLSRAFNGGTYQTSLLMELYQDLKKLREEDLAKAQKGE